MKMPRRTLRNLVLTGSILAGVSLTGCSNNPYIAANDCNKLPIPSMFEPAACDAARRKIHEDDAEYRRNSERTGEEEARRGVSSGKLYFFFAGNNFSDLNNDGKISYPGEFVGVKKTFRPGERIELFIYNSRSENSINPNFYRDSYRLILFRDGQMIAEHSSKMVGGLGGVMLNNLLSGSYEAKWVVDGTYTGSNIFEVSR